MGGRVDVGETGERGDEVRNGYLPASKLDSSQSGL